VTGRGQKLVKAIEKKTSRFEPAFARSKVKRWDLHRPGGGKSEERHLKNSPGTREVVDPKKGMKRGGKKKKKKKPHTELAKHLCSPGNGKGGKGFEQGKKRTTVAL